MNVGNVATFSTPRSSSIIDLELINDAAYNLLTITRWRVDNRDSHSDHRYVLFDLQGYKCPLKMVRNLKRVSLALDQVAPLRQPRASRPMPWITRELLAKREELNRAYKKRRNSEEALSCHKRLYTLYRREVRAAKVESWKGFCSDLESPKDLGRILSKDPSREILRNLQG
eukprot:maker-scaffold411_size179879-snap-gene-0.32 protein:Tk06325 transcript:maker-scaffold411_size179879-snap-gene-0.32-mRNA-1 annotation:"reverse transcriptase"